MTLFITLSLAQADTGPFNLFSNADGYISAIALNVTKAELLFGYAIPSAPAGTTIVRVKSIGTCRNSIDVVVGATTTTSTSTTTTTTTLGQVFQVVGDCCSGVTPHFITYNPVYGIGSVVASITEGFLGGYTITAGPIPGTPDLVLYNATDYVSCGNFLAFWAGNACV